jgi:integrase
MAGHHHSAGDEAPARGLAGTIRSSAPNTVRAYRSDWGRFSEWARAHGLEPHPAEPNTLCLYLNELAGTAKASTIARRLAAIGHVHRATTRPSPTEDPRVKALWAQIRGRQPRRSTPAEPIEAPLLRRISERLPGGLSGVRDRALLLVGFAGTLRRSQIVAIDVEDLRTTEDGVEVTVGRTHGRHRLSGNLVIPRSSDSIICAVRAVDAWCHEAELSTGPLFRAVDRHGRVGPGRLSGAAATRIVQRAVARAGVDAAGFSAESLRTRPPARRA